MINGQVFRDMVLSGANAIDNEKEKINSLNVFPVPDGDTGINMSLTMQAAKKNLLSFEGDLSKCADVVSSSLLRGARGNSGVILSLFFRGIAKELKGLEEASTSVMARAFKNGVDSAYKAVRHPTEGTILTVMRLAADAGLDNAENNEDMVSFFECVYNAAADTLAKTPEMLPVLKQAKVVDAGGKGLLTIFEGMFSVLKGEGIIESTGNASVEEAASFEEFNTEDIKFAYCTECIVDKKADVTSAEIEAFEKVVMNAGDSDVFVDDTEIIKVHVHTNDPGKVLSAAVTCGALATVKVENMKLQHSNVIAEQGSPTEEKGPKIAEPEKKYGFVSVAAGEGLCEVFKDLGVDVVVEGGQTMNPSTEDIISAVYKTPSEVVYVLPNNKNIYMAAKQASEIIEEKQVIVIRTTSVPQGISSMLAFDESASVEDNTANMKEAKDAVFTASMTFAARDSVFENSEIHEGQTLGLVEGKVKYVEDTRNSCMEKIASDLSDYSYITLFYGCDVEESEAEEMCEYLRSVLPSDKEVVLVNGGQPVYYYLISAE
ncbi:MAG: DAK2 domain-containing protein [Ruminococcaceae bacterium]|nr:DAK2 domain-containing protein [Oscillospiraceae bacterium]